MHIPLSPTEIPSPIFKLNFPILTTFTGDNEKYNTFGMEIL